MEPKESPRDKLVIAKSKSEEVVTGSSKRQEATNVRFADSPTEIYLDRSSGDDHQDSKNASPKFSRRYFTNWRQACDKTKYRTRELLRRWRTMPETETPEEHETIDSIQQDDTAKTQGWTVHVWNTWVNRYSLDDEGSSVVDGDEEEDAPPTLSPLQAEKMTLFFAELLDSDHDEIISEQDLLRMCEKLAHFADWSYNSPEFHMLLEVKDEFVENFINPLPPQYSEKMYWRRLASRLPRGTTDLKNWLARWPLYLPSCGRFHQLPLFLKYFCKILFGVINRSGSGFITRHELKAFYMSVIGLSQARCDEIIDTAYNFMTSNDYLELDFDTYKRCFSNWLCGKNPNGAGQWAFVPPRGPLSVEPYPVDYSALNSDPGRLERYGQNNMTIRHSAVGGRRGMVSTRGPKYKFSEGEKVLCYEPDPTKAKVLYDSKVVEVIRTKDKRGRPVIEYLIHFQGWNSSWDRCVSEDFVLKDTDENRQLQRSLAEKSQLQIGAYLYRKERKKTTNSTGNTSTSNSVGNVTVEKRGRKRGLECEGSSSSGDLEERDLEISSQSDSSYTITEDQKPESVHDLQTTVSNTTVNLGPGIKDRLTADFELIMKQGRVITLPARPNVLEILEGCVKQYTAREVIAKHGQRKTRTTNPPHSQDQIAELLNKLHLLHEIADGIRVYFDHLLSNHLLYKPEYSQYRDAINKNILQETNKIVIDENPYNTSPKITVKIGYHSPQEDYSHSMSSPKVEDNSNQRDVPYRRLRSHKLPQLPESSEESAISNQCANINPVPTISEPTNSSVLESSGSTDLSGLGCDVKGTLADIVQKAFMWHIVPSNHPPFPSAVYGAVHLARLFVKLPEFLSAISMAEVKLKLIIKYIEIFADYLEEHGEWFGETYYCEASSGQS